MINKKEAIRMLFLEYPKCSTCQKAKKWLDEHQISYEDRHIVENNPTFEELKGWYERSDLRWQSGKLSYECSAGEASSFRHGGRRSSFPEEEIPAAYEYLSSGCAGVRRAGAYPVCAGD